MYEEKPKDGKPECTCPWRFDCSQADEVNADEKGTVTFFKYFFEKTSLNPKTKKLVTSRIAKWNIKISSNINFSLKIPNTLIYII